MSSIIKGKILTNSTVYHDTEGTTVIQYPFFVNTTQTRHIESSIVHGRANNDIREPLYHETRLQ